MGWRQLLKADMSPPFSEYEIYKKIHIQLIRLEPPPALAAMLRLSHFRRFDALSF